MENGIPKSFTDLVGTKKKLHGGLFSGKKAIKPTEYDIIDVRWGSGVIMDLKTLEELHPTVELLVKNKTMKRSRWTRGFACREIKLKD